MTWLKVKMRRSRDGEFKRPVCNRNNRIVWEKTVGLWGGWRWECDPGTEKRSLLSRRKDASFSGGRGSWRVLAHDPILSYSKRRIVSEWKDSELAKQVFGKLWSLSQTCWS
jgi:hypothetical protein